MSLKKIFKSVPKPKNPNSIEPAPTPKDKNEEPKDAVGTFSVQTPENSVAAGPPKKKSKRYFPWKEDFFVQFPWLSKDQAGKLFCKACVKFPNHASKKFEFVKGWSGNEEGFKYEYFTRHSSHEKHLKCMQEYRKLEFELANNIIPEVKTWANKLPASTNEELRCKFIAANIVATENLPSSKFAPILTGFKMVGAVVGTTHRNCQGFNMLAAIEADLDSFDYVLWKLNIGNWHWVAVFHSPAPGSVLHYWDTYGSKQDRQRRMKDAMGATINRLAEKIDRSWVWDKGCAISEGTSLVHAPEQRKGSNDCGAAVNELGRRLVFGESVTSFDLAANGNLYRVRQASEILEFILQEGLQ